MRKEITVTLEDGGESKSFKIRQMPATKSEQFLFKIILLLGGKAEISKLNDPMTLLASISDKPYDKIQELMDALLSCISRVNDGGIETQLTPENADGFVDDTMTLLKLRAEAFKINNIFRKGGETPDLTKFSDAVIKRRG